MDTEIGSIGSTEFSSDDEKRDLAFRISGLEEMLTATLGVCENNIKRVPNNIRRVSVSSADDAVSLPKCNKTIVHAIPPYRPCAKVAGRPRQTDTVECFIF